MKITTEAEALEAVQKDGLTLSDVPDHLRTEAVCLQAGKQDRKRADAKKQQEEAGI